MFSKFVTALVIVWLIMAFDDWLTVRMCDSEGHFKSYFNGTYTCTKQDNK